jgi:hypothetical protein
MTTVMGILFSDVPDIKKVKKHPYRDDFTVRYLKGTTPVSFAFVFLYLEIFQFEREFFAEIVHDTDNSGNFVCGKHTYISYLIF